MWHITLFCAVEEIKEIYFGKIGRNLNGKIKLDGTSIPLHSNISKHVLPTALLYLYCASDEENLFNNLEFS